VCSLGMIAGNMLASAPHVEGSMHERTKEPRGTLSQFRWLRPDLRQSTPSALTLDDNWVRLSG
jgi:hypothetical protein